MLENQIDYLSSFNQGVINYNNSFQELITPLTAKFISEQLTHPTYLSPSEFIKLNTLTYDLLAQSFNGSLRDYLQYLNQSVEIARSEGIDEFFKKESKLINLIVKTLPKKIQEIEKDFGFHFDNGKYNHDYETNCFDFYQVLPNKEGIEIKGKPLLIIPPYVLGYDILAFLPNEGKSFVHEFANNGIPTYIRIIKPILKTPSVQTMSLEDECRETKEFCNRLLKTHNQQVTLAGYCQSGFTAMLSCLSGKLEKEVDALITFVSPMDGTKSTGINKYLIGLPDSFKSLKYATRILPNGNTIIDGSAVSALYRLKSMATESPISTFLRDVQMIRKTGEISNTMIGLNRWLASYKEIDLPKKIIETADISYAVPITSQGDLPIKLFNKKLNFKDIDKYLKYCQLNISTLDNLVEPECARIPKEFSKIVEVIEHKTGHVGIALSPQKFLGPAIEFHKNLSK